MSSRTREAVARLHAGCLFAALLLAVPCAQAAKGDIYVYKQPGGARYYTDQQMLPQSGYAYIGRFGRPTAYASCKGMNPHSLATRAARYEPTIKHYARHYGVNRHMIKAVMRVESCFDSRAVSRVGAGGLMQLMPRTAKLMGVKDRFDPAQNIRGGVHYLRMMLDRFHDNWKLALAAYNAGPNAVTKYKGVPPFKETQHYIQRVMNEYEHYRKL